MACKVKNISVAFDRSSKSNTFTNGDLISGRVTLEVAKKTRIESLFVKAEGEASVLWSENHGKYNVVVYHDHVTCFQSIHYFIQDQKKGKASHCFTTLWLPKYFKSTVSRFQVIFKDDAFILPNKTNLQYACGMPCLCTYWGHRFISSRVWVGVRIMATNMYT